MNKKIGFVLLFVTMIGGLFAQVPNSSSLRAKKSSELEELPLSMSSVKSEKLNERRIYAENRYRDSIVTTFVKDTNRSNIRIALLAPFDVRNASWRIYGQINAKTEKDIVDNKLKESIREVFDFYEGLKYALQRKKPNFDIDFYTFDCGTEDSTFRAILKNDTLKTCDVIIGPGTTSQSRLLAEYCKKYKIINVNTFVTARNITTNNPYMVRLKPTIEGHMRGIFNFIIDTIKNPNIIICAPSNESGLAPALYLDTLFETYNKVNDKNISYQLALFDSTANSTKSISGMLKPGKTNIVVNTGLFAKEANKIYSITNVANISYYFGMPNWMEAPEKFSGVNNLDFHYTDFSFVDSSLTSIRQFQDDYNQTYYHNPSAETFFGYDCINFIVMMIDRYGKNFTSALPQEPYNGLASRFWFYEQYNAKTSDSTNKVVNYYSNESVYVYKKTGKNSRRLVY